MTKWSCDARARLPKKDLWEQVNVEEFGWGICAVVVSLSCEKDRELVNLAEIGLSLFEEMLIVQKADERRSLLEWKEIVKLWQKGIGEGIEISIGVVVVDSGIIKIIGCGKIDFILERESKKHLLMRGKGEIRALVGKVREGDKMSVVVRESDSEVVPAISVYEREEFKVSKYQPIFVKLKQNKIPWQRVGVVALVLFVIMLGFGMWRRSVVERELVWERLRQNTETILERVGTISQSDPEEARESLDAALRKLEEYREREKGKYEAMARSLEEEVSLKQKEIFREKEVAVSTFIELGLIEKLVPSEQMVIFSDKWMVFETEEGIVQLNLLDRSQKKVKMETGEKGRDFVIGLDQRYKLGTQGVFRSEMKTGANFTQVVVADEAWQTPARIAYFGGNLYVMDKGSGEISKYVITENGVGSRSRWFGKGVVLDLSKIVDIVVDGDVWLLSSSGKLERYTRGVPARFAANRFDAPTAVFTSGDLVYVLEKTKSRVLVYEREGKYVKQYLNTKMSEGKDLVVVGGKAYILTQDEVLVFEL